MQLYKPTDLHKLLNEIEARPRKAFSQNFLIDGNIVKKFINTLNITKEDTILEIGPGPGVLTQQLLEKGASVIVVEKDDKFAKHLSSFNNPNLKVYNEDFLKFDLKEALNSKKVKVITSVPYNITTPILIKLLENYTFFSEISLMVQKEVAHRLTSLPNSKTYGSITLFVNYYSNTKFCFKVSKNSFYPAPKVDSAIIKLSIKEPLLLENRELFHKMTRQAFNQRRKKLTSSLKTFCDRETLTQFLKELDIDINCRPEQLDLDSFLKIFKKLFNCK